MRKLRALGIFVAMGLSIQSAHAIEVNLTFDDLPTGAHIGNLEYGGLRLSPCDYYSVSAGDVDTYLTNDSNWFGFGGITGNVNPQSLGDASFCSENPYASTLFIDHGGAAFTLDGFTGVLGVNSTGLGVFSSNGGVFWTHTGPDFPLPPLTTFDFSGPEWTDIQWLKLVAVLDPTVGFDNLRVAYVDEPGTMWMLAVGFALAVTTGLRWQRKR